MMRTNCTASSQNNAFTLHTSHTFSCVKKYFWTAVEDDYFAGNDAASKASLSEAREIFFDSYNNLVEDAYMQNNAAYRLRRFGRYQYDAITNRITSIDGTDFFQAKKHNALYGGVTRKFAAIDSRIINNTFLIHIIKFNMSKILKISNNQLWNINIHQIRIVSKPGEKSMPAPEGIHRDGHEFVAQVFIGKKNICGGISKLYNDKKEKLFSTKLKAPLETIILNDEKLYHDVTPIYSENNLLNGFRDMLLIDFNSKKYSL